MQIELLGLSGAKIQTNDTVILLSPPSIDSELKAARYKADIVVLGKPGDKTNVLENNEAEKLFVIDSAGEFEAKGVFFYCLNNPAVGETVSILTSVTIEGITITHLAGLNRTLSQAELDLFDGTDVLLIPVGGGDVLTPQQANALVAEIEPRVVIPMHFFKSGLKTRYKEATDFLKEVGSVATSQEKIKITKKDLPQEDMMVVYLQN